MKRFLSAGEGYAQNSLTYKLLLLFKRYIQTSSPNKFGWLAYPSWVAKVTGIQFLVAVFSSSPSRSVVEVHSKDCRSPLEGLSKRSRTTVEADSNNSQRSVEQVSKKRATNPLKNPKSIYSAFAGFISFQSHYVPPRGFTLVKPRCKHLWAHALSVCLSVVLLCAQSVIAKEADRGGDEEVAVALDHSGIVIDTTSTTNHQIPTITVGQRVPDEFWTKEFQFYDHEKVYTQTLEQYKGKPIILDLWHIYCGACLTSFPFLNELQTEYGDELIILPVNSYDEDLSIIDKVLTRLGDTYRVTSIFYDDYLKYMFPHVSTPQYIWILPNGLVEAVTIKLFLNQDTVSKFVKGYEEN